MNMLISVLLLRSVTQTGRSVWMVKCWISHWAACCCVKRTWQSLAINRCGKEASASLVDLCVCVCVSVPVCVSGIVQCECDILLHLIQTLGNHFFFCQMLSLFITSRNLTVALKYLLNQLNLHLSPRSTTQKHQHIVWLMHDKVGCTNTLPENSYAVVQATCYRELCKQLKGTSFTYSKEQPPKNSTINSFKKQDQLVPDPPAKFTLSRHRMLKSHQVFNWSWTGFTNVDFISILDTNVITDSEAINQMQTLSHGQMIFKVFIKILNNFPPQM